MWNWLRRMFTLPKSRNSLSDVLPEELANLAEAKLREMIRSEVKRLFDRYYPQREVLEKEVVRLVLMLTKIGE